MGIISRLFLIPFMLVMASCTSLIYYPDKFFYAHPDQFGVKFEAFKIKSKDGTELSAWRLFSNHPKKSPKNLLLYFHGNAQNLTSHFVNSVWMSATANYDVIIFDYRGYGLSKGLPEPKGVAEDGEAFLNYAFEVYKKEKFDKFIIYAQSLGGAVSLKSLENFAHREDVSLLVLDSTFLSPREVARDKTFWPLSLIISNSSTADPKLKHITMPVLSIHSTQDPVISHELGEKLFNRINDSEKKEFWTVHEKGHGDIFFIENNKYRQLFLDFVEKL